MPLGDALSERRQHSMLAVDQFEEVFTACSDVSRTNRVPRRHHGGRHGADGTATIVIAMRADFYGRCAEHRALASLLASRPDPGRADGRGRAASRDRASRATSGPDRRGAAHRGARVGHRRPAGCAAPPLDGPPRALDPPTGPRRFASRTTCVPEGWRERSHGWRRKPSADSMPTGRRRPSASCFAWRRRAKGRRWSDVARRSRSSTWTATPTRRARWRSSPTPASSPSRKGRPRSPTKRCSMNGRGCGPGSRTMRRDASSIVTSRSRRTRGTRVGVTPPISTVALDSRRRGSGQSPMRRI